MARTTALLALTGALSVACVVTGCFDWSLPEPTGGNGGGSEGGAAGTTSTTAASPSSASTSTGQSESCNTCTIGSVNDVCSQQYGSCQQTATCNDIVQCILACGQISQACIDQCSANSDSASIEAAQALGDCAVCDACPGPCEAEARSFCP